MTEFKISVEIDLLIPKIEYHFENYQETTHIRRQCYNSHYQLTRGATDEK